MDILSFAPAPDTTPTTSRTAARDLDAQQRRDLARAALAGCPLSDLAQQQHVSRKFVAQQVQRAEQALDAAFAPPPPAAETVLFSLPVTRTWLRSFLLAVTLTCHSSVRGVPELLRDLFDDDVSLGTIHNVLHEAVASARTRNARHDLSAVYVAAHDEIFQNGQPVLVGIDVASTYCYLLSQEEHRDAATWAIRLWDLQPQGFAPSYTIADGGQGLRAGQTLALPGTPCRADVFHAERELGQLVRYLENRAYAVLAAADRLHRQAQHRRATPETAQRALAAQHETERAVALADTVAVLATWLRQDILAVAGPPLEDRQALFDFVVTELRLREPLCPHRLRPVCRLLTNQREDLLAFVAALDRDLTSVAGYHQVSSAHVREMLRVQALAPTLPGRWRREAILRQELGERWAAVSQTVAEVAAGVVRASSVIENLKSRLRTYFFLRRHLGPDYLELLRFYLNHRRFTRSEHPERVGRSPAELLSGHRHASWLELLGYSPFRRGA